MFLVVKKMLIAWQCNKPNVDCRSSDLRNNIGTMQMKLQSDPTDNGSYSQLLNLEKKKKRKIFQTLVGKSPQVFHIK